MIRALLFLVIFLNGLPRARADSWMYPQTDEVYTSANGRFRFTALIPSRDKKSLPRHTVPEPDTDTAAQPAKRGKVCVGILEEIKHGKPRTVWSRELVNPVGPLDGMITDDGAFVVTFDNWFGVGVDPIVIYDGEGHLVSRHTLETLGLFKFTSRGMDILAEGEPKIQSSVSSVYWKADGLVFFNTDQTKLIVQLGWGHLFGVRLHDGGLLNEKDLAGDIPFITAHVRQEIVKLLAAADPAIRRQGARLVAASPSRDFIPRLRELLVDPAANTGTLTRNGRYVESYHEYYVREAAVAALAILGETAPDAVVREAFESAKDRAEIEKRELEWQRSREKAAKKAGKPER